MHSFTPPPPFPLSPRKHLRGWDMPEDAPAIRGMNRQWRSSARTKFKMATMGKPCSSSFLFPALICSLHHLQKSMPLFVLPSSSAIWNGVSIACQWWAREAHSCITHADVKATRRLPIFTLACVTTTHDGATVGSITIKGTWWAMVGCRSRQWWGRS